MTTAAAPTGLDVEALWYEAARASNEDMIETRYAFARAALEHAACIADRMSQDPGLPADARRALIEAGAAIRAEAP